MSDLRHRSTTCLLLAAAGLALGLAAPATAQTSLSLTQAIARARERNPDAGSSAAAEREAAQRVTAARAGYWPKVDVAESWQRSNQPVFVFSSLLAQRQFGAADFAIAALNHPDAVDNFRSSVTVEQTLFDGATRANVSAAGIGHEMASATREIVDHDLAASVTNAFAQVLVAASARRSAEAAAETAQADRELAGNRRDAGRVTDADVLQVDLFVARALEQQIRTRADEGIARGQLNQLMGESLDEEFLLDTSPVAVAIDISNRAVLETEAINNRPDVKLAALQEQLAATGQAAARAAFLPQVSAQGGWEFNGGAWNDRQTSWMVGAVARINVFHGFADEARLAEAREATTHRAIERQKATIAARLDVRIAVTRVEAAQASEAVGRAAVEQALESRRIIRDRYEAGLTDIVSLLRATEAVVQAETRRTAAQVTVLAELAGLQRTLGRR